VQCNERARRAAAAWGPAPGLGHAPCWASAPPRGACRAAHGACRALAVRLVAQNTDACAAPVARRPGI